MLRRGAEGGKISNMRGAAHATAGAVRDVRAPCIASASRASRLRGPERDAVGSARAINKINCVGERDVTGAAGAAQDCRSPGA